MNATNHLQPGPYVHLGGYAHVHPEDILFCEGNRNYSWIHFRSRRPLIVSTTLGILEGRLAASGFVRVSRSTLINADCIQEYDNFEIILSNGRVLPIARRRRVAVRRQLRGADAVAPGAAA